MKLNHKYDEIDETLAAKMREDHYHNYRSDRSSWENMRFDYKLSWIIRAQKLRESMKDAAHAVILTIRNPKPKMIDAMEHVLCRYSHLADEVWTAAWDAALADEPTTDSAAEKETVK
jgi:hypothetical protein